MAFNGSGTFVRLYSWANDKANNIKVRADRMDNEMSGMATGLSTCITKDGQTTVTANLPMASYKHTGVANGSSRTDYCALGQAQDAMLNWVVAGGTSDAITATYSPAITSLTDGQLCCVRAGAANTTTTPTFAPNGLTARTITKEGAGALVIGDIKGVNHELLLRYQSSGPRWELLNPAKNFSPITNSLGADVTLNNTGTYFDGPSIAQGTAGTWFVSGTVTVTSTSGAAAFQAKLWDGTTLIATTSSDTRATSANRSISLSGYIVSPAGNLRISVQDSSDTTGKILYNTSGLSKDSTITAIRIA